MVVSNVLIVGNLFYGNFSDGTIARSAVFPASTLILHALFFFISERLLSASFVGMGNWVKIYPWSPIYGACGVVPNNISAISKGEHIPISELLCNLFHFGDQFILHSDNFVPFLLQFFQKFLVLAFHKINVLFKSRYLFVKLLDLFLVLLFFYVS